MLGWDCWVVELISRFATFFFIEPNLGGGGLGGVLERRAVLVVGSAMVFCREGEELQDDIILLYVSEFVTRSRN